jgi:thioredoxin 1
MASSKVQVLNALNFDATLAAAKLPVIVEFTATWCGPCRAQAAILDKLAESSSDVVIAMVDTDDCPELAARFGVRGMPTLLVFQGGKETGRRLGLSSEHALRALLPRATEAAPGGAIDGSIQRTAVRPSPTSSAG